MSSLSIAMHGVDDVDMKQMKEMDAKEAAALAAETAIADKFNKTKDMIVNQTKKILRLVGSELTDLKKMYGAIEAMTKPRDVRMHAEIMKDCTALVPKVSKLYRSIEEVEIKGAGAIGDAKLKAVVENCNVLHDHYNDTQSWYESLKPKATKKPRESAVE